MNALWDPTVAGHCINAPAVYAASNVPNVVADIGIMVVPLPTLCRLQMPWSKKIGTVVVFLAGSVGLAGSCYRLSMFVKHYIGVETDFACESVLLPFPPFPSSPFHLANKTFQFY